MGKIYDGRGRDGKMPINEYYICNLDEPYSESVIQAILLGEVKKEMTEKAKNCIRCRGKKGNYFECEEQVVMEEIISVLKHDI